MEKPVEFTVGGVPEHFNLPWHQSINDGLFAKESITVHWKEYPGGTGAMAKDLRSGELDIAVLLTEGILADIAKGNPSKIIGIHVKSPLIWGIHTAANAGYKNVQELQGKKYAISRMGSGSHLMAFVDAMQRGWQLSEEQLVPVGDLTGAREALSTNRAQIFMWEKFMTQPLVDTGEFSRVGECPTPWPCFVIAARNEVITQYKPHLQKVLNILYTSNKTFKNTPDAPKKVSAIFGLTTKDAAAWFGSTEWATDHTIPADMFSKVSKTLHKLKLIDSHVNMQDLYVDVYATETT